MGVVITTSANEYSVREVDGSSNERSQQGKGPHYRERRPSNDRMVKVSRSRFLVNSI